MPYGMFTRYPLPYFYCIALQHKSRYIGLVSSKPSSKLGLPPAHRKVRGRFFWRGANRNTHLVLARTHETVAQLNRSMGPDPSAAAYERTR